MALVTLCVMNACQRRLRYSSILTCLTYAIGVTVLARFKKFSCLPSRDLHRGNQYTTREEHNLTRYVRRVLVIILVR